MASDDLVFRCPPERLRVILEKLVKDSGLQSLNTGRAFAQVMHGEPDQDRRLWYRGVTDFLLLIDSSERYVQERITDYATRPHQKTLANIRSLVGQLNLEAGWSGYFEQFRPYVETSLPFVVDAVEIGQVRLSVPRASVEELTASIEGVRRIVKESDFAPLLKYQLDGALNELLVKIAKYELWGLDGIADASASVVSTIIVQSEAAKASPTTVKSVLDVIVAVQTVILNVAGLVAIGGPIVAGLLEAVNK